MQSIFYAVRDKSAQEFLCEPFRCLGQTETTVEWHEEAGSPFYPEGRFILPALYISPRKVPTLKDIQEHNHGLGTLDPERYEIVPIEITATLAFPISG